MEAPTLHEWAVEVTSVSLQRFDRRLTEEIATLRSGLHQELATLQDEMRHDGAMLRQEIGRQRRESLKWAFIFWIGQAATTAALVGGVFALAGG